MSMSIGNYLPRVYTLPACPKCDKLKRWLDDKGIKYEASDFTTDVQLEMIMKNMFGNPSNTRKWRQHHTLRGTLSQ